VIGRILLAGTALLVVAGSFVLFRSMRRWTSTPPSRPDARQAEDRLRPTVVSGER
jgi:hypothetical protein